MPPSESFPAVRSARLPAGVVVQPRVFEFEALDAVPQHWFADNPLLTHGENAFSIFIPPGERFFIRSVRHFEDRATDPELRELIRAFAQQESLHMRAHNQFNESFRRFGVDLDREMARAERAIGRLERWLPKKMQLGATVFLEHLTATGAHALFAEPEIARLMHPETERFWRWHAAEELEHKAVAFDLFVAAGGRYPLRVLSALAAVAILAVPVVNSLRGMLRDDPTPVTASMGKQARGLNRQILGPQLRMIAKYFMPSFHPWDFDDQEYLEAWYASPEPSA